MIWKKMRQTRTYRRASTTVAISALLTFLVSITLDIGNLNTVPKHAAMNRVRHTIKSMLCVLNRVRFGTIVARSEVDAPIHVASVAM